MTTFFESAHSQMHHDFGIRETFTPNESGYMELRNRKHQVIVCQLIGYDPRSGNVKIRLKENQQTMWFSPDLLGEGSRRKVESWTQKQLTYDQVQLFLGRVNADEDGGYSYTINVKNRSDTKIENLSIVYEVFICSKTYNSDPNNRMLNFGAATGSQFGNMKHRLKFHQLEPKGSERLETHAIQLRSKSTSREIPSTSTKIDEYGNAVYEHESKKVRNRYSEKLDGIAIHLYFRNTLIKTQYSSSRIQSLAEGR